MCNIPIPSRIKRKAKEANIEIERGPEGNLMPTCKQCSCTWQVLFQGGGRNPRNWWKCPQGCNG